MAIYAVSEVNIKKYEVVFALATSENQAAKSSIRICCNQQNSWRLQSSIRQDDFCETGAVQLLSKDIGEEKEYKKNLIVAEMLTDNSYVISSIGDSKIVLNLSPFSLCFYNKFNIKTAEINEILSIQNDVYISGSLKENECIYGTGERFDAINQRGKLLEMMAIDKWCETQGNSYAPVPFVISSYGYGLFLNRYEYSTIDLGYEKGDKWSISLRSAPMDLYVFVNKEPKDTLFAYSSLSGFAPKPPDWSYGIMVCRHGRTREFSSLNGIKEMISAMDKNHFPWDAIIIEGWNIYDSSKYSELKETADIIHSLGKKILAYEPCGRFPSETDENYTVPLNFKPEYMVHNAKTGEMRLPETKTYNPADSPDSKCSLFVDITNPDAREWWYGQVWGKLVNEIGIDGCKIDFCEQFPEHLPLDFYDGRNQKGAHQWYPVYYNVLMHNLFVNEKKPDGGMCFSRGGGIGTQRYPFIWIGDQKREWQFLRVILKGILSSGISGIPFVTHDLSAYRPTNDIENNPEDRVFVRGVQMGAFTLSMQTHGTVKRPYDFDEPVKRIYRIYSEIHNLLRPYIIKQGEIACKTGMPCIRNLFLYDCNDTNTWEIEDEFVLGDSLLVAPVFEDSLKRDIYLPSGRWLNIFNNVVYSGKTTLRNFDVPFEHIPVFCNLENVSEELSEALDSIKTLIAEL